MAIAGPNLAVTTATGTEKNAPTVLNTGDAPSSGGPTTPSLARGLIANTSLGFANDNLAHVCDITGKMKYAIAWAAFKISEAIAAIRTFLEGLWSSTSSSPFGDQVRAAIKYIKAKVEIIKKYIIKVKDAYDEVQKFMADLQALIAWIMTLPAKLAAILKQCLSDAMSTIKDAISNAKEIVTSQTSGSANTATSEQASTESTLSANESIVEIPPVIPPMSKP